MAKGRPLVEIMTMSQPDLDYITQVNGGNVGAVGSFSGNVTCPNNTAHPHLLMECRIHNAAPQLIKIEQCPAGDLFPYKIVIGNAEFGVGLH